jgi:predicted DsbA family dithiol-disulfide isomerase
MLNRLTSVAGELGLAFGRRSMTYNSRLAQELGKWAEAKGVGDAFHHAVFLAYFRDGKNIGDTNVLIDLCQGIGLDPGKAQDVLTQRTFFAAVDEDWKRSRQNNIRAVPTFMVGLHNLVGFQSVQALEQMVENSGVQRR